MWKIKPLHDLVFNNNNSSLAILIQRGSSLDISVFHSSSKCYESSSRQQCSIEFWYHLPCKDGVMQNDNNNEILLVRRVESSSCCFDYDDTDNSLTKDNDNNLSNASLTHAESLWELLLLPSG